MLRFSITIEFMLHFSLVLYKRYLRLARNDYCLIIRHARSTHLFVRLMPNVIILGGWWSRMSHVRNIDLDKAFIDFNAIAK